MSPYVYFTGIFLVVMGGVLIIFSAFPEIWTIITFPYPVPAKRILVIGIFLVVISLIYIVCKQKSSSQTGDSEDKEQIADTRGKDNRRIIMKLLERREKYARTFLILFIPFFIVSVIIYPVFALSLLCSIGLFALLVGAFIMVMKEDSDMDQGGDTEKDNAEKRNSTATKLMRLIDYRRQPISVSLVVFVMTVTSYSRYGYLLDVEVSNSSYAVSLPGITLWLTLPVFANALVYIIHHFDFLGFHRVTFHTNRMTLFYFMELIFCGVVFLIWLFTIILALIKYLL